MPAHSDRVLADRTASRRNRETSGVHRVRSRELTVQSDHPDCREFEVLLDNWNRYS